MDIEKILNQNYEILSNEIAINEVYKIHVYGDLKKEGYEIGYLFLPINSGIKKHQHISNVERYKLIDGSLKVDGQIQNINICSFNEFHNIDLVTKNTLIQTIKIDKEFIEKNNLLVSNDLFENILKNSQE